MDMTKDALDLFLQSLPPNSMFEIISFGTSFKALHGKNTGFNYSDETLKTA